MNAILELLEPAGPTLGLSRVLNDRAQTDFGLCEGQKRKTGANSFMGPVLGFTHENMRPDLDRFAWAFQAGRRELFVSFPQETMSGEPTSSCAVFLVFLGSG